MRSCYQPVSNEYGRSDRFRIVVGISNPHAVLNELGSHHGGGSLCRGFLAQRLGVSVGASADTGFRLESIHMTPARERQNEIGVALTLTR
jgi:hypothetical protein